MKSITIKGSQRESVGKVATKAVRNAGMVPCVIYGGSQPIHFAAEEKAFKSLVYTPNAHTVVIDLDGKTTNAVLQDIPELLEVFKNLGDLVPLNLSIVKCRPRANISVHIDSDNYARLLWPIKNCKGSYTKFFEVDNANIEKRYGIKKDLYYHINNVEDAKLLENVELTQPVVFKPWIPHGVWSNPEYTEPRLTLTIKFNKSLEYMLK